MIAERATQAINGPALAPSLFEALIHGGLSSEDATDRIDAHAAIQWAVHAVKRQEQLLGAIYSGLTGKPPPKG